MEEVSLVNYTVKSFHVSYERFSPVLPLGWTSSLLLHLINCVLCLEEDSPLLLFPGVNEMRRKVTLSPPRLFSHFGWSSAAVLWYLNCSSGFGGACSGSALIQVSFWARSTPAAPLKVHAFVFAYRTNRKLCSFVCKCVCPQGWDFELKVLPSH